MKHYHIIEIYNNAKYKIDAQNEANQQLMNSKIKNELKLLDTEKVNDNRFKTKYMITYEDGEFDYNKFKMNNININSKLIYYTF